MTWTSDLVVPPDHQMTFKDALHILSTNLVLKIILPDWAMHLTKHTRKVDLSFTEIKVRYFKKPYFRLFQPYHLAIHAGNGGSSQECR
jgi:hypothetical protein